MENESEKELTVAESIDVEEESTDELEEEFDDSSEQDTEEDNESSNENDAQDEDDSSNDNQKEQSKEERAMYASARKEVEHSVDKKHKEALDRTYQKAYNKGRLDSFKGKINPYTGTKIEDLTDLEVYEDMYKISESGGDPLKDYASYTADKKREEARLEKEQAERETKAKNEIDEFTKKYPDVNLSELLNNEQFKDYAEGKNKSLVDVYESYNKFTNHFRNKAIETAKKTIANGISSPGSLSNSSENVVDYNSMSKEDFEKEIEKIKAGF